MGRSVIELSVVRIISSSYYQSYFLLRKRNGECCQNNGFGHSLWKRGGKVIDHSRLFFKIKASTTWKKIVLFFFTNSCNIFEFRAKKMSNKQFYF